MELGVVRLLAARGPGGRPRPGPRPDPGPPARRPVHLHRGRGGRRASPARSGSPSIGPSGSRPPAPSTSAAACRRRSPGVRLYPIQVAEKGFAAYRIAIRGTWGHGSMPRADNAAVLAAAVIERLAVPGPDPRDAGDGALPGRGGRRAARRSAAPASSGPARRRPGPRGGRPRRRSATRCTRGRCARCCATRSAPTSSTPGSSTTSSRATPRSRSTAGCCPARPSRTMRAELAPADRAGARRRLRDRADRLRRAGRGAGRGPALRPPRGAPSATTTPTASRSRSWCRSRPTPSTPRPSASPTYGFSPLRLDPDERFLERFHGVDERVSLDALRWGLPVLYDVVRRFCG